jgi:hypothetical protein
MIRKLTVGILALAAVVTGAGEFSEAQAKVKEKYPKEFAEIQKLAATDMAAAQKKLYELAAKGKILLPREFSSHNRDFGGRGRGQFGGRDSCGRGGFGGRGGRSGRGGMMGMGQFNLLRRYIAESQIKSKFAEEYAAADKEFLAAIEKIETLAQKAKVTLPLSTEIQIRKLRAKAPEEFAKLEELSSSNPREVFGKLRELSETHKIPLWEMREHSPRGGNRAPEAPQASVRENPRQLMRKLQQRYPEEMKKLMALRDEDPREFARQLQELNRRYQKENSSRKK